MIINSILDNDLYKFSMMQAIMHKFPRAQVKYEFINRGKTEFPAGFAERLRKEVKNMESLYLTDSEREWFQEKCYFLDPIFFGYLKGYQYDSSEVGIIQNKKDLQISIEGLWVNIILWEVPIMAIISELFFEMTGQKSFDETFRQKNNNKKKTLFKMNGVHYADFGTRRRFSYQVQDEVVENFADKFNRQNFVGTSNVHLAMKYDTKPIGTHAHEWFMFHAAKYGYKMANHLAMEHWTDVFRGDLGIALSDTLTTEVFFESFDKKFAKLYDGVRHDSGDPLVFADKVIRHYEWLGIDPKTKVIVFSDGLDPEKAVEIKAHCRGKIMCSFGIGTNFSNDVGVKPLNMVIKMTEAKPEGEDWHHCIKLSDSKGKYTGDKKEIEVAKYTLNIE